MKELNTKIDKARGLQGVSLTQLEQASNCYLYERSDGYFGVFLRKENKRYNCVSYPGEQAFGVWAWCYRKKEKAMEKFNELKNSTK